MITFTYERLGTFSFLWIAWPLGSFLQQTLPVERKRTSQRMRLMVEGSDKKIWRVRWREMATGGRYE